MVLTKCVEPPTPDCPQVAYDFKFIEDYVKPTTKQQRVVSGGREARSIQFSRLYGATAGDESQSSLVASGQTCHQQRDEEDARPLMKPTQYTALDHPLSLMVCGVNYSCNLAI